MIFNSFQFLWLFPIIFVIYYLVNSIRKTVSPKYSNLLLLFISYALYVQWNPVYALVLLGVTAITYCGALALESHEDKKKIIVCSFAFLALIPLLVFKYYNFVLSVLIDCLGVVGIQVSISGLNWAIPLGISFFSFQAVGYLLDVYNGRVKAEKNWWNYMLFVSFFPQIASGPISRAQDLLPQIKKSRPFEQYKVVVGLRWLLWGMFLKVVVADRLGIYVDKVYDSYMYQSGLTCAFAACLYSIQIYADFAGYSFMAVGVGRVMGFDLVNNFERPYCAASISEFWKRWHISLTRWLKTHVYIAMGGNRCSKLRQYWNIMVTFLISGIWHGANWNFIVWGALHGLLQIFEKILGLDPKGRFSDSTVIHVLKPIRIFVTFIFVTIAWVFFRMPSFEMTIGFFEKIALDHSMKLFSPAPDTMLLILIALFIVVVKDFTEEFFPKVKLISNKNVVIRWITYFVLCVWILLAGVFDASNFIYANF